MTEDQITFETNEGIKSMGLQEMARSLLLVSRPHSTIANVLFQASSGRVEKAFGIKIKKDEAESEKRKYPVYHHPFSSLPFYADMEGRDIQFHAEKLIKAAGLDLKEIAERIKDMGPEERSGYLVIADNEKVKSELGVESKVLANSILAGGNGIGAHIIPAEGEIMLSKKLVDLAAMGRSLTRDNCAGIV